MERVDGSVGFSRHAPAVPAWQLTRSAPDPFTEIVPSVTMSPPVKVTVELEPTVSRGQSMLQSPLGAPTRPDTLQPSAVDPRRQDRQRIVEGKSVCVRGDLGVH